MRTSSRSKNYFLGLSTGYITTIVTILVSFWLTPFTLGFLDREKFAIFSIASDILVWLTLLDLGISAVLSGKAAQLLGLPEKERINRIVSTAFFAQLIISLMMLVLGLVLSALFPLFFNIQGDTANQASIVMALLVIGSVLTLGTKTFSALLIANQQIHIDNLINLLLLVIRTGLIVFMLIFGWGLISLAIANLSATIITSILSVLRVRKTLPEISIKLSYFSWDIFHETFNMGIWFTLGGLAGILILGLDRTVAAKMVSLEAVTTLILTGKIYALSGGILQQIANTSRPMLSQLIGQGKKKEALRAFQRLFIFSTGGSVIVAITIWSANSAFIRWWVGGKNYGGSLLDLALAINLIVHNLVLPNRALLAASLSFVRKHNINRLVEGIFNLIFSIIFALKFGLLGIAIGTSIASIITSCWYLPVLTAKTLETSVKELAFNGMIRVSFLGAILLLFAFWIRSTSVHFNNVADFIVPAFLTGLVGCILLWCIGVDKEIRSDLVDAAGRVIKNKYRSIRIYAGENCD